MARRKKPRRRRLGERHEPDPQIRAFKACHERFGNNRIAIYACETGVEYLADEVKKER